MKHGIYIERKEVIKKEIGKIVRCDICGKIIFDERRLLTKEANFNDIAFYWKGHTGHRGWGSDSPDSFKYFDICSKECVQRLYNDYMEKCINPDTGESFYGWFLELERTHEVYLSLSDFESKGIKEALGSLQIEGEENNIENMNIKEEETSVILNHSLLE